MSVKNIQMEIQEDVKKFILDIFNNFYPTTRNEFRMQFYKKSATLLYTKYL